jgi:phosphonate transport system ATP-binding protein
VTRIPAAFEFEALSLRFGELRALDSIELEIAAGEAVGFVGPSGAGKTSLLRMLIGAVRPTTGRVLAAGRDLASLSRSEMKALRASIGFVHQDLSLVPNLRVSQNVLAGRLGRLDLLGSLRHMLLPRRSDLVEVHRLLERVGIEDKLFERTDRLSGGQKQRVAIARAVFQEPSALIADEAVSSVDPARARDTVELLTRISQEEGLTLCMSLHSLDLARDYFPRLIGMRAGRVVFDRSSEKIGNTEFDALYDLGADEMWRDGV